MSVLKGRLLVWLDPIARPGPEAMAVDEWLLETCELTLLRVYPWAGEWGSVGYFGDLNEARRTFPGLDWVRRFTGGGIVDHRADWTYTLVVPKTEPLTNLRGAESYRIIHAALARALQTGRLSDGSTTTGDAACFSNPVAHDLVGISGEKLAGAGQRRTKHGLLQQGSVAGKCLGSQSRDRAIRFAGELAEEWDIAVIQPDPARLGQLVTTRYADPAWTARR